MLFQPMYLTLMVFKQIPFAEMFFEQTLSAKNVNQTNAYYQKFCFNKACLQNMYSDKQIPVYINVFGQMPIYTNVVQTNACLHKCYLDKCLSTDMCLDNACFQKCPRNKCLFS